MELNQNAVGILIHGPQAHQIYKLGTVECWSPQDATAAPEKLPGFRLGHNIFPKQNVVASD